MKEKMSIINKILILIISGIGLFLNFKILGFANSFLYFTTLSNVFCFIFYLITLLLRLFKKLNKNDIYYILKGLMTLSITLTMIIYYLLYFVGKIPNFYGHYFISPLLHLITPLLVIIDYVVYGSKGNSNKKLPFAWSILLIVYTLVVIIYSLLGGTFNGDKYPYDFMNIEKYGLVKVAIVNIFLYVLFIIYGFFVQYIDKKISKNN